MNRSEQYEIDYARVRLNPSNIFILKGYPNGGLTPLDYIYPKGIYTISSKALYAGNTYTLGVKLENINLKDKENDYRLEVFNGLLIDDIKFDDKLNLLVFTVQLNHSTPPTLNITSIVESLWSNVQFNLFINDTLIQTEDSSSFTLAVSYKPLAGSLLGEGFVNGEDSILSIMPNETTTIELVSGGGAGAGLNLNNLEENQNGQDGGDVTLYLIEPDSKNFIPVVFLQGGKGGKKSVHAFDELPTEQGLTKDFHLDGYVYSTEDSNFKLRSILYPHKLPVDDINNPVGVEGYKLSNGKVYGSSGNGGYLDKLGYRGGAGVSGAMSVTTAVYSSTDNSVGPFLLVHPKTLLNTLGYLDVYNLDINKNSLPLLAGKGGESLTDTANGTDGTAGTMIVERRNA